MTKEEREKIEFYLADYDEVTERYMSLSDAESGGRNYEDYEDALLDIVHVFADFVRNHINEQGGTNE